MKKLHSKTPLEKLLYDSFLLLSAILILFSLTFTLYFDISRQRKSMDRVISGAAAYIATMPDVIAMLDRGYPDDGTKAELDSLCDNIPDISIVAICDTHGLRFYHTDRQKTGETLVGGDEIDILNGSEPYITTGYGTKGSQRRAFHAIKNSRDEISGYVMASVFTATISARHQSILLVHGGIFLLMMVISVFLTHTILGYLTKALMGHDPDELVSLYIRQDAVINSFSEGLIATDRDGTVIFSNQAAEKLLSTDGQSMAGRKIQDIYPPTSLTQILEHGQSVPHHSFEAAGHTLLVTETPISGKRKTDIQGILIILNDQTESLRLSDELSGARSMLDTLRAFNHEFLNKLHIILGYLQTGEIERAIDFITNSSLISSQAIRETASCIRVSRICALVIGKMMHAAELGILLSVTPDSRCLEQDLLLPLDSYITIIGNLLENAIEDLAAYNSSCREIRLGIHCRQNCTIITCEDTGSGIDPDLLPRIFEKGVSSKGENRGTGLYLIHQIVEDYHGEIAIETEPDVGTCFTLTFTKMEA